MTHKFQHLALHEVLIRAMLKNKKKQHRIQIKPMTNGTIIGFNKERIEVFEELKLSSKNAKSGHISLNKTIPCPFFVGQRLHIKEKWLCEPATQNGVQGYNITYLADKHISFFPNSILPDNWKAPCNSTTVNKSVSMPQVFSRLSIVVTSMGVDRLSAISNDEAILEGVEKVDGGDHYVNYLNKISSIEAIERPLNAVESFISLWESTKGIISRCKDPYVWIINFNVEVVRK